MSNDPAKGKTGRVGRGKPSGPNVRTEVGQEWLKRFETGFTLKRKDGLELVVPSRQQRWAILIMSEDETVRLRMELYIFDQQYGKARESSRIDGGLEVILNKVT